MFLFGSEGGFSHRGMKEGTVRYEPCGLVYSRLGTSDIGICELEKKHMRLFKEGTKILLDAIRSDSWISLSLSNNYDTFKFNLTPNSLNNLATQRCMLRHRMHLM